MNEAIFFLLCIDLNVYQNKNKNLRFGSYPVPDASKNLKMKSLINVLVFFVVAILAAVSTSDTGNDHQML